jgi:hypothetical protein
MHTFVLFLFLVNFLPILIARNRRRDLLEDDLGFVVRLLVFVFHGCHHCCLLLMGTIKMLADLFTCFTLERRPKLLREEFLVWESLATEEFFSKRGTY